MACSPRPLDGPILIWPGLAQPGPWQTEKRGRPTASQPASGPYFLSLVRAARCMCGLRRSRS